MNHLQVHTEYSLLDGTISVDKLILLAKKHNMDSVAITDNGTMYGVMDFYFKAKKAGISPIIGCEMYVVHDLKSETADWLRVILLAKNYDGYQELSKLVTKANIEGMGIKPRVTIDDIKNCSDNLISIISSSNIEDYIDDLRNMNNLFLGISRTGIPLEEFANETMLEYADNYGIPIVAINNIYFATKKDARLRDIAYCIQKDKKVNFKIPVETEETYFKSGKAMEKLFEDIPEAIANTMQISSQCNVEIPTSNVLLPEFECPRDLSPEEYLRELTYKGLVKVYPDLTQEVRDRADFELEVISKMGFPIYFLIVWDFVKYARSNDIPVGDGRGSVGGSIVAYALDITKVDPIKYNTLFERFLNPDRVSMPDIDLDFCIENRYKIFDYLSSKYGEDRVSHIGTVGTLATKAVIRDVGRTLGVPLGEVDKIAKLITQKSIQEALNDLSELREMYNRSPLVKKLLIICDKLEGNARHMSIHAAGALISRDPLSSIVPLIKRDDNIITQYAMTELDKIGLLKVDLLGLRNLTVVKDCLTKIRDNKQIDIDLDNISLEDEATFKLLRNGNTSGVFQLESEGMKKLIRKLKPQKFEEIAALLALYRPGPLGSKMDRTFVANKNKIGRGKEIEYELPELKPILEDTYGVILYQEQVMKISNIICGFTLAQADMLRKAIGKKNEEEMAKLRDSFVEGGVNNGYGEKKIKELFDIIEKFAAYSFNKSHSIGYALLSYKTAYLKANHPVEYMTALLSSTLSNLDRIALYIQEARVMGVTVLCPDVNRSAHDFTIEDGCIRFGLGAVKGIGEGPVEAILDARKDSIYNSLFDFVVKMDLKQINKGTVQSLVRCGAFDNLNDRSLLLATYEFVLERASDLQKQSEKEGFTLEGDPEQQLNIDMEEIANSDYKRYSNVEKLNMEKEVTGIYMSGNPLDDYVQELNDMENHIGDLDQDDDGIAINLMGILTDCVEKKTKFGKDMVMANLTDLTGTIRLLFFPNSYSKDMTKLFIDNSIVTTRIKLKVNDRDRVCFVDNIKEI